MPPPARKLVVTGATGKQGGALIRALLAQQQPTQPFAIYALTRDKPSRSAQALAAEPNVHVIQGDFADPEAVFRQLGGKPWGLFSVTMPMDARREEREGKGMVRAACEAGVEHIVFTATERGGQTKSDTTPTSVPHFRSKYNIEREIQARSKASPQQVTWTFLRPVAFFENLSDNFFGRGYVAMWRLNGLDRPLQQVSTTDIGLIAADAFLHADSEEYRNKAISLAGDELSPNDAARIFKEVTGQELPYTYPVVGRLLRWVAKEQLGLMFDWFVTDDFGVDVKALRKRYPFMQDFRTWLAEESAWKKA
ncbi:hypothetical protein LTR91_022881 [Friedmanniomyces endolithicus]|uniref:NmrA-like domain-containing protein n=1 Tax=Friedmanniomyces endolithicus TaxID=329885 RepID=A0AAN6H426_9PEZI|nr:hypothetical protein LTR94_010483 [Friedmanniomyces endolithicus]KAK0793591.1 hypothetical protein LTR38_009465 [Friedmanniomyces endolithicus]KAK0796828.1 hypothetical protein LTR59_006969 [Friedmanniomyces endolithicus]KAK0807852.1 hypothetical protein LTR75_006487 [Friedmanniomyces endolithicus]KAK0837415.1 hypothetical protein LTR03_012812 [Friedmanniomyces endolithicus]